MHDATTTTKKKNTSNTNYYTIFLAQIWVVKKKNVDLYISNSKLLIPYHDNHAIIVTKKIVE